MSAPTGLALYTRTARGSASHVIRRYSTSFHLASRLLPPDVRRGICDLYALVRVADEIVDGPAREAGVNAASARTLLDELESETLHALQRGFSSNLIVHAFAVTARGAGIDADLITPFFASMRTDLGEVQLDEEGYRAYVHGSAEVVGSMCLRVFLWEDPRLQIDAELEEGARSLGAAFQKVNFLRDLADDTGRLGRRYLPGLDVDTLTDAQKDAVVAEINADLRVADGAIARLPSRSRRATAAAAGLFAELNNQLQRTPASELAQRRISVGSAKKLRIVARAAACGARA